MATDAIGSDAVHVPVMRARILDLLGPTLESGRRVHVDGTLGMGGHAEAVLTRFPDVQLVGIDRPAGLDDGRSATQAFRRPRSSRSCCP